MEDEAGNPPLDFEESDIDTTCTICMAEFLDSEDLFIHMKQVHVSEIQKSGKLCAFCSESYSDLMAYAYHIRDNHLKYFISCKYCMKVFTAKSQHQQHEAKHHNSYGVILCSQCSYKAPSSRALAEHENSFHNNNLDGVILKDCLPFLSVALKINASIFLQSLGVETVYICVGCDFSTLDVDTFIEHSQQDENPVFVCCICSNTYTRKRYLARHNCLKAATVTTKKQLTTCPDCNTMVGKAIYAKHKKYCKVIKCHICNIVFENMYDLSEHQSAEHPLAVELTNCPICKKSFVGQTNLQHHIDRTHKGRLHMYKYLCIYCNDVFKHPQRLFGHYYVYHKDISPYTCKICDKTFRARKSFTIHIKLEHKSEGFVEFDENYHVFFAKEKSEKPFVLKSVYKEVDPEPSVHTENNLELVEGTDCNYTETDGNATEFDAPKVKLKVKRVVKTGRRKRNESESSDDEPLAAKKANLKKRKQGRKKAQSKFVCDICNKNCYTCQNYTHHMSLHSKTDDKKCIKCLKVFKSKGKLSRHVEKHHSSSKLTETLKNLLEKRKFGVTLSEISQSEKFRRTIKKVEFDPTDEVLSITPVEEKISVQKFIENFTPDDNIKADFDVNVTVTLTKGPTRDPVIKMTKFNPTPLTYSAKLAMPVKFKDRSVENSTVNIKVVHEPIKTQSEEAPQEYYDDHDYAERAESIPDVAEEVLLEETEEKAKKYEPRVVTTRVRNKLTEIKVAHMLPEAPFFKIVKVNDVLPEVKEPEVSETIELPDGTKLVTTNPLAHLLGDTPVDKVLQSTRNKYYKSKQSNLREMLAKALSRFDYFPAKKAKH